MSYVTFWLVCLLDRKSIVCWCTAIFTALSGTLSAQLTGAEMRYSVDEKQSLTVELIHYYPCGFDVVPEFEYVSLFETMAKSSQAYIKLEQAESKDQLNNVSAPCKGMSACMNRVVFRGSFPVHLVPGGYDLVWRHCCMDDVISNTERKPEQGIVLTTHIYETAIREGNASPVFANAPFIRGCQGLESSSLSQALDTLDRDSLHVEWAPVFSDVSTYDLAMEHKRGPEGTPAIPAPPFKALNYNDGFSHNQPFGQGGETEIEQPYGLIKLKADQQGKYLVSIAVSEYRGQEKIGTTQRIFFTEIH